MGNYSDKFDELNRQFVMFAEELLFVGASKSRAAAAVPRSAGVVPGSTQGAMRRARTRGHDTSLFPRLVLGWINADFRVQICIFSHFSRSTRNSPSRKQILQTFAEFCKLLQKIFKNVAKLKISKIPEIFANFHKIVQKFRRNLQNLLARR